MRRLFLLALPLLALGQEITYDWLDSKPRNRARDFYTLLYLEQKPDPAPAEAAFFRLVAPKTSHLAAYAAVGHKQAAEMEGCRKLKVENLDGKSAECVDLAVSLSYMADKGTKAMERVASQVEPVNPEKAAHLQVMASDDPWKAILADRETFFSIFNTCGAQYRTDRFNKPLPEAWIRELEDSSLFDKTVELIATNPDLEPLQKSLLAASPEKGGHNRAFFLGLMALKYGDETKALAFFQRAEKKAWYRHQIDKTLFWQWLVTKDEKLLKELDASFDVNLYTILVREKEGRWFDSIRQKAAPAAGEGEAAEISDPFAWFRLIDETKEADEGEMEPLLAQYPLPEQEPYRAFILERASHYKEHYFITPFEEELEGVDPERKALIYALARQESRFVPEALSRSYAIGVMQMMPFLIRAIGKNRKEKVELTDFFQPEYNLKYAKLHVNWLVSRLEHPLFISYAYNGGIGFTTRMLKKEVFNGGKYDPYMSMELVHYAESREYGKKVLANYVVYRRLFGVPVTLTALLKTATKPTL